MKILKFRDFVFFFFSETFYWFGDNNHTEWEELFSMYNPPPYRLPGHTGAYSFGLAGKLAHLKPKLLACKTAV